MLHAWTEQKTAYTEWNRELERDISSDILGLRGSITLNCFELTCKNAVGDYQINDLNALL